jgi:hypothetical protein
MGGDVEELAYLESPTEKIYVHTIDSRKGAS